MDVEPKMVYVIIIRSAKHTFITQRQKSLTNAIKFCDDRKSFFKTPIYRIIFDFTNLSFFGQFCRNYNKILFVELVPDLMFNFFARDP